MAPDTLSLSGKIAIVTGSGRENGIGAGIARALARNGAAVTIHYVTESVKPRAEKMAESIRSLGTRAVVVQADLSTPEGASKLVRETLKAFDTDHIDILVNNAGGGAISDLLSITPAQIQNEIAINVSGPLYMTQAVVAQGQMPPGGRIVNIGSVSSKLSSQEGLGFYSAAKAAADSLTQVWAGELGRSRGITVNTVAPGPVATDIIAGLAEGSGEAVTGSLVKMTRAADRIGTVEDTADAVLLLIQERARFITAQWVSSSGGIIG